MKIRVQIAAIIGAVLFFVASPTYAQSQAESLSEQLLYAVKTEKPIDTILLQLAALNELSATLNTDAKRKSFWLNIYNACIQIKLNKDKNAYRHRRLFFKRKDSIIANIALSLNEIEHVILRKNKSMLTLGYFHKTFTKQALRRLEVDTFDNRIHFALNCGATSCPPIRFYTSTEIETQLDIASQNYLMQQTVIDTARNKIKISKLFLWFKGDFGTKNEVLMLLKKYQIIAPTSAPKIQYLPYNWRLAMHNYE